ncbi:AsnC family transcriptional regulator [Halohasta salina]|uniref:AsnC family transcriptional regulator n=1 Tax=Halohasta salina TaxID=2961621 RepID=UPI0020A35B37|nr:AsnC family transcriptional regulator [Halohasta salina]
MRDLDDTDRTIIRLLLENARRPYSDLADHVDLSPPAVADRIDRLEDLGVIEGFTLDLDSSMLREGVEVLVDLAVDPGQTEAVAESLADLERVEHQYVTADARVVVHAALGPGGVDDLLAGVDTDHLREVDVSLLSDASWTPRISEASLAVDCDECGNAVTTEGESAVIDGTRYHFCCGSCLANFEERFEELQSGI